MIKNIKISPNTENHSYTFKNLFESEPVHNGVMTVDYIGDLVHSLETLSDYIQLRMREKKPIQSEITVSKIGNDININGLKFEASDYS
tara:strand:- start:4095 stop:4358 length:264 start_codon:yes stop_codon:yes gene_type:complete